MTLELPEPFTGLPMGAWAQYGKRKLTIHVIEPGRFTRNDYDTLYVEVIEREPYKGEPLYLSAHRTQKRNGGARQTLTDAANKALAAVLLPPIQRYGFSRAWADAYAAKAAASIEGLAWEQDRARREAAWWEQKRELHTWMAEGLIELRPVPRQRINAVPAKEELSAMRAAVLVAYAQGTSYQRVVAEALLDGEVVGYMTDEANLVPPSNVLDQPAKPHPPRSA